MKPLVLSLITILFSMNLYANKLARVSIDSLLKEANQVAIVRVLTAEVADTACGVIYTAKVTDPIKNTQKDQVITLSDQYLPTTGLRTGAMFLVFSDNNYSKGCNAAPYAISHAGYAAFWVGHPYLIDYDTAVKIPKSFVETPKPMNSLPGKSGDEEVSEIEWLDKNDLLQYLKNIPKNSL